MPSPFFLSVRKKYGKRQRILANNRPVVGRICWGEFQNIEKT